MLSTGTAQPQNRLAVEVGALQVQRSSTVARTVSLSHRLKLWQASWRQPNHKPVQGLVSACPGKELVAA